MSEYEYEEEDIVRTEDGLGVVSGVFDKNIVWTVDGSEKEISASPDNVAYIVALLSGGSRPYRGDEIQSDTFDNGNDVNPKEMSDDMKEVVENEEGGDNDDIVPGDGKEGSDKNDPDSADSTPEDINFSESVEKALKNKVEEHNEEYGDEEGKSVTMDMLKAVYRRGAGAYSDSHREGITRNQWAMARVNAFLYLVRNENPENENYVQDNDLLPEEHPVYVDEKSDEELISNITEASYKSWYDSVDEPENLKEVKKELAGRTRIKNVAVLSRKRSTSSMSYDELIDVPAVDDPGVGWDEYPDSWQESEQPNRLILLKAWAAMGATWRGCFREMSSEMTPRGARRLCSSMKDEVYGTEKWRSIST